MSKEQPAAWRFRREGWPPNDWIFSNFGPDKPHGFQRVEPLYPASALDAAFRRGLLEAAEVVKTGVVSAGGAIRDYRTEAIVAAILALAEEPGK